MNKESWVLIGIGVLGGIATMWFGSTFTIIALDEVGPAEVGKVFLGLIFVALVIERATEVYVNVQLEPEKQKKLEPVVQQRAQVKWAQAALEDERGAPSPNPAAVQTRENELAAEEEKLKRATESSVPQLQEHKSQARKQTSILAMSLGVLAGLIGIRALAPFLDEGQLANCMAGAVDSAARAAIDSALKESLTGEPLKTAQAMTAQAFKAPCNVEEWQRRLFSGADVILTGALLAGGADGLHNIVKRFTEFGNTDND